MKVRSGFVSNSSSSSFLLLGYEFPSEEAESFENSDLDIIDNYYASYTSGRRALVGEFVADVGEDIEEIDLDPVRLARMKETLKKRLGKTQEPKFYLGERET